MTNLLIDINKILFDKAMVKWTKHNCDDKAKKAKLRLVPPSENDTVGNLNESKLKQIEKIYFEGNSNNIDPITLKEYILPSGNKSGYYLVIDGRHRVVKALYHEKEKIAAKLIN
uniref:ParB/Sulfiredoxin domain-containing protein n=1 Tax=viral metagenome TaxID=1070528 RepID=A0A6C0JFN6_9ZZZZ